ncbi:MAG: acetate--CoA ligase family protein [Archaeoglobus sp.]|nr:acetate--CoA ligase family protein [Archaeoglobus sp.]
MQKNLVFLPEHLAKELLERYGISTARCVFVKEEDSAVEAANEIGYPVVMKVASTEIIHKSDAGGVLLDIRSEEEVREAFRRLMKIPKAEGVNVQPMLKKGIEAIVGVIEDQQFGKAIMFGLGGIFVEIYNDVSFRILPITRNDAEEMIREIKGYKVLDGYRGLKGDVESLIDLLLKISEISEKEKIKELDLNPVFVYEKGYTVADARIWKEI